MGQRIVFGDTKRAPEVTYFPASSIHCVFGRAVAQINDEAACVVASLLGRLRSACVLILFTNFGTRSSLLQRMLYFIARNAIKQCWYYFFLPFPSSIVKWAFKVPLKIVLKNLLICMEVHFLSFKLLILLKYEPWH